jgi:hypothetical protein
VGWGCGGGTFYNTWEYCLCEWRDWLIVHSWLRLYCLVCYDDFIFFVAVLFAVLEGFNWIRLQGYLCPHNVFLGILMRWNLWKLLSGRALVNLTVAGYQSDCSRIVPRMPLQCHRVVWLHWWAAIFYPSTEPVRSCLGRSSKWTVSHCSIFHCIPKHLNLLMWHVSKSDCFWGIAVHPMHLHLERHPQQLYYYVGNNINQTCILHLNTFKSNAFPSSIPPSITSSPLPHSHGIQGERGPGCRCLNCHCLLPAFRGWIVNYSSKIWIHANALLSSLARFQVPMATAPPTWISVPVPLSQSQAPSVYFIAQFYCLDYGGVVKALRSLHYGAAGLNTSIRGSVQATLGSIPLLQVHGRGHTHKWKLPH